MTNLEEIKRGEDAAYLLNHYLFADAFRSVREAIVTSLMDSAMGDEKTHNRLAIALQLCGQIEKQLRDHINTGKMAAIQADDSIGQKLRRVAGFR